MPRPRDDIRRELESAGESLANVERARDELKARITALRTELEAHSPTARPTPAPPSDISPPQTPAEKVRLQGPGGAIQDLYRALADDEDRSQCIVDDIVSALEEGRSPIVLTERKDHLDHLANRLRGLVRHLIVLMGGTSAKERRQSIEQLNSIPKETERLILATGR